MRPTRSLLAAGAAISTTAALLAPAVAQARPTCGAKRAPGGDWPAYGHDYANTRSQPAESVVSPGDAPLLSPAWTFSSKAAGGEGDFPGTPVVARGCVYVASTRGWVFALNADSGALVWKAKLPYGGGASNSVAVARRACGHRRRRVHGRTRRVTVKCATVFVVASRTKPAQGCPRAPCVGPYAVALDAASGRVAWATRPLDTQPGADVYGSPVVFHGVVLAGVSGGAAELGDEADRSTFQGSLSFLSAASGRVLRKTWTIHPPKHPNDDFAGGAIWSTPAVDAARKVAYVGAGNPFRVKAEHPHTDAVLEFNLNRRSRRFGRIVGSYKGNVDEYTTAFSGLPCYDIPGNPPPFYPQGIGSCGQIDMDFGASPNLLRGSGGRELVGAGQKSGVYHVFDARTLKPVWKQVVGPPGSVGGIVGSTAYDGRAVYGPITVPGYVWSISAAGGSYRWFGPVADGAHWGPPVAEANGVVYTVDLTGFLDAYDARNGVLLAKRPLALGGSAPPSLDWGGVSVARHTVYAAVGTTGLADGFVVAFRPGSASDTGNDVLQTPGELGGGGGGGGGGPALGATIIAVPGSTYTTYATPVMTTQVGGPLSFANFDVPGHDVTSVAKGPDGAPLFHSRLVGLGETAPVEGLGRVQSGKTYEFYCSVHPGMRGQLIVR